MTVRNLCWSVCDTVLDTAKQQVIGYNGCRLGLAAEKHVPQACLPTSTFLGLTALGAVAMAHEEWRDIAGYEGIYQVSNMGRIRSLDRRVTSRPGRTRIARGQIRKPSIVNGYPHIILRGHGHEDNRLVHRLVAEAFIEPVEGKNCVDHINGNKADNRVENLRWVTIGENNHLMYEQGLVDLEKRRMHGVNTIKKFGTPTPKKAVIRNDGVIFESVTAAAKAIGVSQGSVSSAIKRDGKCKGYTFKFVEHASESEVTND